MDNVGLDKPYRIERGPEDDRVDIPGSDSDSVEFKIIGDDEQEGGDTDMPLFEIVKPRPEEAEPLEMSLLEDEAIEFDLMKDDEISEDALEVEPIEVEDEDFSGIEVEPLEVDEIEDEPAALPAADEEAPGAAPETTVETPKKSVKAAAGKKKVKRKAVKRKTVRRPVPVRQPSAAAPVTSTSPRPAVAAAPKPAATITPKPAAAATTDTDDLIKDIEKQLVVGSPCTQCGASLTNPNFCTQCGSKVVVTPEGVQTVPRE